MMTFFCTLDCSYLSVVYMAPPYPFTELIIFKPLSILDAELTLLSFLCSGLLSSDYVEIHYENGKPQYSKVWLTVYEVLWYKQT